MGGFARRVVRAVSKPKPKPVQTIQKAAVKKSPAGPTTAELAQQRMSSIKRRGRKSGPIFIQCPYRIAGDSSCSDKSTRTTTHRLKSQRLNNSQTIDFHRIQP